MKAGKLLGKGSYGCVFDPPIECVDGTKPSGVGKVSNKTMIHEQNIMTQVVQKIDPMFIFTNPIVHVCQVTLDKLKKDSDYVQCELVSDQQKAYDQLVYKERGSDLFQYSKSNDCFTEEMMPKWITFINGLLSMSTNKYSHFDIKPENMILTDKKNILLIDFGTTLPFSKIYDDNELLKYEYYVYPPEFKVYYHLQNLKNDTMLINMKNDNRMNEYYRMINFKLTMKLKYKMNGYEYIRHKLIEINNDLETVFYPQLESFMEELINQMKRNNLTLENDLKPIFNQWANKVDVFSLGVSLAILMRDLKHVQIIRKCIHANPAKRISMQEVKDYFMNLYECSPEECMTKYTLHELKRLVDEKGLDKGLKRLSKQNLCDKIYKYLEKRSDHPTIKKGRKSS